MARAIGSRVSLCMIVRNEAENLADCVGPVKDLFDQIVIVDTGSTDNTREIAASLGAEVHEFPWVDDFSAARNTSLQHATGDWIFWLDADDRIDATNRTRLAALFDSLRDEPKAYNFSCVLLNEHSADAPQIVTHARLFRRDPRITWRRRVHEENLTPICELKHEIVWTDVEITHVGYRDPVVRARKRKRDLNLLRLDYAVDPHEPVTLFYMGMCHYASGELSTALVYLLRCHQLTKFRSPMVRKLYAMLVDILGGLNRREDALALSAEGLENFPDDPELLFARALHLSRAGDHGGAERCLLRMIRRPTGEKYYLFGVQSDLCTRKAAFQLGLTYCDQQRFAESERVFQELLAQFPDYSQAWVGLGQVYLSQQRWRDTDYVAQQLRKCPGGDVMADILTAENLSLRGNHVDAQPYVERAMTKAPRMIWPRIVYADILMRRNMPLEQCILAWQNLLQICPGHPYAQKQLAAIFEADQRRDIPVQTPLWSSITTASGNRSEG